MESFVVSIVRGWREPRDVFVEELVASLEGNRAFQGLVEGSASQQARELDSVETSRSSAWISPATPIQIYFENSVAAQKFCAEITKQRRSLELTSPEAIAHEDWNKKWKDSYKGCDVEPYWRIIPAWNLAALSPEGGEKNSTKKIIRMNPSLGFGTGEHATTQLCLSAMARHETRFHGAHVLDFGSGSGILSVAAAKLGAARVEAVEIDAMAVESSRECVDLNQCSGAIQISPALSSNAFDIIIANILKNVLIEFGARLVTPLEDGGLLILSGLLAGDVDEIIFRYSQLWNNKWHRNPVVIKTQQGDWFSLELQ
jgi:ribosomal protein L11 methyltransferase